MYLYNSIRYSFDIITWLLSTIYSLCEHMVSDKWFAFLPMWHSKPYIYSHMINVKVLEMCKMSEGFSAFAVFVLKSTLTFLGVCDVWISSMLDQCFKIRILSPVGNEHRGSDVDVGLVFSVNRQNIDKERSSYLMSV